MMVVSLLINLEVNGFKTMSTIRCILSKYYKDTQEPCSINDINTNNDLCNEFDTNISVEDHGDLQYNEQVNNLFISHKAIYATANTKFSTMWRLVDSNKKLQNSFISALDQFIERTLQNKSIDIQSWVYKIASDTSALNIRQPVPGMVSVLPTSRYIGRYTGSH